MILDDIVAAKREEVARAKRARPLTRLLAQLPHAKPRDFLKAIHRPGRLSIIAEIKYASPSKGQFGQRASVAAIAKQYQAARAQALSVLTDRPFFHGAPEYLAQARRAVRLPILRKDFIIDEYQIYESRALHADAILLIAGLLSATQLKRFLVLASKLGLSSLVEVHDQSEVRKSLVAGSRVIGINNRDLHTFHVDLATTERLRPLIPARRVVVSESGIHTRADVAYLERLKIDAILVGETLMRSGDIGRSLRELRGD